MQIFGRYQRVLCRKYNMAAAAMPRRNWSSYTESGNQRNVSSTSSFCYVAGLVTGGILFSCLPPPKEFATLGKAQLAPDKKQTNLSHWIVCPYHVEKFSSINKDIFKNKTVKPDEVNLVLFHGGCPDGFASAFAAYLRLKDKKDVVFRGMTHDKLQKSVLPDDVDGKVVALLDYTLSPETMKELCRRARKVIVLDHHASAEKALAEIPEDSKVFVMNQSGATMSWNFFHGTPCPLLFRYIEDRDIWRWILKDSRAFSAARQVELPIPKPGMLVNPAESFKKWKQILDGGETSIKELIEKGKIVLKYENDIIKRAVKNARVRRLRVAPDHPVLVVNSTILASEIGNELARIGISDECKADVGYAMVASYRPGSKAGTGKWLLSLRSLHCASVQSLDDEHWGRTNDVSEIAGLLGGGGHKAAAGACVETTDLESIFIQE